MVWKRVGEGTARPGGDCGLSGCDQALKHPRVKMLGAHGVQWPGVGSRRNRSLALGSEVPKHQDKVFVSSFKGTKGIC